MQLARLARRNEGHFTFMTFSAQNDLLRDCNFDLLIEIIILWGYFPFCNNPKSWLSETLILIIVIIFFRLQSGSQSMFTEGGGKIVDP